MSLKTVLLISLLLGYPVNRGFSVSPVAAHPQTVAAEGQKNIRELAPTELVETQVTGGQVDSYQIRIAARQCGHILITSKEIVLVRIIGPAGEMLSEALAPGPIGESTRLSILPEIDGPYRVDVSVLRNSSNTVRYSIQLEYVRAAAADDQDRAEAERLVAEGQLLGAKGDAASLNKAVDSYDASLKLWQKVGDRRSEASTLGVLGSTSHNLSRHVQALDYYQRALPIWRSLGDRAREAQILSGIGWTCYNRDEFQKALDYYNQALPIRSEINDYRGQAQTITAIGQIYAAIGEPGKAIESYNRSLPLARRAGDRVQEAYVLNAFAFLYVQLQEYQKALGCLDKALPLWVATGNRYGEADALNTIGIVFNDLGQFDKSLDYYNRSMTIWQHLGNRAGEADALNNIGSVYWHLGGLEHAPEQYKKAVDLLNRCLAIRRAIGQPIKEVLALNNLGLVYDALGEQDKALECFSRVLELNPADLGVKAAALQNLGLNYYRRRDYERTFEYSQQALGIFRSIGDKGGEARALRVITLAEEMTGKLDAALADSKAALDIIESVRSGLASAEMRAAHHVLTSDYYDLLVGVLGKLHLMHPSEGYDIAALEISEKDRARGLLDLLHDARIDISRGVDPTLLQRERALQQELNAREQYRLKVVAGGGSQAQRASLAKEVASLADEYNEARARVRASSPRYANLTRPSILTGREIQQNLLDENTALVEYFLAGTGNCKVWAVTTESIMMTGLPGRIDIEAAAKRFYASLLARNQHPPGERADARLARITKADADYGPASAALSEMLLGPISSQLGKKRLVFVAQDMLQYIPFGALPSPVARGSPSDHPTGPNPTQRAEELRPLILDHEIVNLPSASVLSILRMEIEDRTAPAHLLAVVADPVFNSDDPRIRQQSGKTDPRAAGSPVPINAARIEGHSTEPEGSGFRRLRFSRQEADEIAGLAPRVDVLEATDFAASHDLVSGGHLDQYRILHFATHGVLNNQHPDLSGIVLSLVDETGKPTDGFLRLNEIYNLKLNADLVVLSACETALGKQMRGEGLIGLTRGFMYAGVPRVVASLWSVDDRATAELMKRFYKAMLIQKMPVAAALRSAQISLMKEKGWQAPYYWAPFTLQGEWK